MDRQKFLDKHLYCGGHWTMVNIAGRTIITCDCGVDSAEATKP